MDAERPAPYELHGFDEFRDYVNALDVSAYLALNCWWAFLASRPETAFTEAYDQALAKLQPHAS